MSKAKSIYQTQLDNLLQELETRKLQCLENHVEFNKPKLLLHACCGPCSSYVLEYLSSLFNISVYFYNPNIYPQNEYERRLEELKNFYTKFPAATNIQVIEEAYNPQEFYSAIGIQKNPELAFEKEKGERCGRCYKFRLQKAFDYACEHNFDYFCTSLSISPFKDAEKINSIGFELEIEKVKWLPSDFKKKGGFKRSLELSEEYGLYRQQYCGCVYSMNHV